MVYIREKKVGEKRYLYLVKSVWDPEKKTSRQEVVKYLGNSADASIAEIPAEYRTRKINEFFEESRARDLEDRKNIMEDAGRTVLNALLAGNSREVAGVYEALKKSVPLDSFLDGVLRWALYEIGNMWQNGKIGIADEHVASNAARDAIGMLEGAGRATRDSRKILICTPAGEEHNIGCKMLQVFLQGRGYSTINLSPSAPYSTILRAINESSPDIVLVSIGNSDNISVGRTLIKKIMQSTDVPVIAGGSAFSGTTAKLPCIVLGNAGLRDVLKGIRTAIRDNLAE